MTLARRIIPCLDTDGARVVKGVHFEGLRDAGNPVELAARYNEEGADELVVLDIAASRDNQPTFLETIRRVAAQLAIPLTAGGGIRTLEDGRAVIRAGADKITVNTAAVERPALIRELSNEFGAQAVVLAIDAKWETTHWEVRVHGGRTGTGLNAEEWALQGVEMGAGEILVTSMDRDGTQSGFDNALTSAISRKASVPVIASGGAKLPQHFLDAFTQGSADAALAASIFHDQVQSIRALKSYLQENGVEVRPAMLIPCIDLQGGQAVQLVHGRKRRTCGCDVFGLLQRFAGYSWLHLIDLDAAMRKGQNNRLIKELCLRASGAQHMKVRVGGGIRTTRRAQALLRCGAEQVIIGSAAFRHGRPNIKFLKSLAAKIGKNHVLVALDTMKGQIVIHGWRKSLSVAPADVMEQLTPYCAGFLCTDVDREGTMRGANLRWFHELRVATKLPIVAAGGVSTKHELRALEKMGMDAAVGMALYKNRLS